MTGEATLEVSSGGFDPRTLHVDEYTDESWGLDDDAWLDELFEQEPLGPYVLPVTVNPRYL